MGKEFRLWSGPRGCVEECAKQVVADYLVFFSVLLPISVLMLVLPRAGYRQNEGTLELSGQKKL